jgi:hypothetical protein
MSPIPITRSSSTLFPQLALCLAAFAACAAAHAASAPATRQSDLLVFGGTPAGIMAAVAAGRAGADVLLVEPSYLIGGMMSGGLHKTDIGKPETIGGLSREFFDRVLDYYRRTYGAGSPQVKACDRGYYFEPKMALRIFGEMLAEARVEIRTKEQLHAVEAASGAVRSITTRHYETGAESRFAARIFIDGSYEGDLMAQAGVLYRVGREARAEYNEPLAGLTEGPVEYRGAGDHRVQAFNMRSTLCVDPENRVPIPRPRTYYREAHAQHIRTVNSHGLKRLDELFPDMPRWAEINGKLDPNKADFTGVNFGYTEGDYEQRARITARVQDYWLSLWYLLQNDPELPEAFKADARRYGLPKDEYLESNHVSPQIYVRVARRMQGRYLLTQRDVQYDRFKPDGVCMGSYNTDCHPIQAVQTDRGVLQEGDFNGSADPYEIPYRCLTPHGVRNLLVVAAVSATHVAYSSVRMEPVFMMLGQAGGLAAHLAFQQSVSVQDVPVPRLRELLQGARVPLEAPYRPWIEVRVVTPPPHRPGIPIEFEIVDRDVRAPFARLAWNFDGSGEVQADGRKVRHTFAQGGRHTVMVLAQDRSQLLALPAVAELDLGGDSFNREVHYQDAQLTGRWARARGPQIEYRSRVGLIEEGKSDGKSRAVFTTTVPRRGRYRVAAAFATGPNRATNARVAITHADGTSTVTLNQRKKETPYAFVPVGEFEFRPDHPASATFTNEGADGAVIIDTVRWIWLGDQ